jgi:hypothetical protein
MKHGPNLYVVSALLCIAYVGDLILTMMGQRFVVHFRELNPLVSPWVDTGDFIAPALLKLIGLAMILLGIAVLRKTRYEPHYSWLLGACATFYLMLDTYQAVNLS